MADASHLERMGRELKCPICLSLLSCAVSLTCNHVFCNVCIDRSMKSASNCPVCKVPYRRREIRPTPHMDNLVSIYKSMEVASGEHVFVTQPAVASTRISGEGTQAGVNIRKVQDNGQTQMQNFSDTNEKLHQRKRPKSATISTQRSSQSNQEKPSFPTKKRVQVLPYQTSGDKTDHTRLNVVSGETGSEQPKKCSVSPKDMPLAKEKGELRLSPFFWLRDDDGLEKLSQQTDCNHGMCTPSDPCFIDNDSNDETPCRLSPHRGMSDLPDRIDLFDSEMFDWTQRPCSPELCSNPLAMQVEDFVEQSGARQKAETALTEITTQSMTHTNEKKNGVEMSNKKASNVTKSRKSQRSKRSLHEVTADYIKLDTEASEDNQEGSAFNLSISKRKQRKGKKGFPITNNQEEKISNQSDGLEPLPNTKKIVSSHISASENIEKINTKGMMITEPGNMVRGEVIKRTTKKCSKQKKLGVKGKCVKLATDNGKMIKESENTALDPELGTGLLPTSSEEVFIMGFTRTSIEESGKQPKSPKKVKFSADGASKDNCAGLTLNVDNENILRCNSHQEIENLPDQFGLKVPSTMDKAISLVYGGGLRKCNTSSTFHCSFCRSSEESEATGSMAHYLDGKLVACNRSARKDAIHMHKICAEWAPNVYFEDDNVINLEAELTRSKRIRCCCCGIKGAALGCYEQSCRKSFHVTCAKLTPQCRWDYENFVMLCPIHASCRLPNEMAQVRSARIEKSTPANIHHAKASSESGSTLQWKSQKKVKSLVICCSALTNTEKGVVTEFVNLSGVTILKSWDPTVTHVIASTDENGACRRTLKYLMGILNGKWILSVEWIKACVGAGEIVDENHYEISIDIHGISDGPRFGRLRVMDKQPKLFAGISFFFTSDFEILYKGYLRDLIIAAGGKVLNRKPVASPIKSNEKTFIIYSVEVPDQPVPSLKRSILNDRLAQAEALAGSSGAVAASNSWILNSISGHKLQEIEVDHVVLVR